jgi:hypothetical protein
MKKKCLLVFLLFTLQNSYGQDTIQLKDVVISDKKTNRKEIKTILEKIRYNLRKNYNLGYVDYATKHFSVKDNSDTLVNRTMINRLDIKTLDQFYIHYILLDDPKNPFHTDTSPYFNYQPHNDSWLSLSIFYDSLHVIDFDFFHLSYNYRYEISKIGDVTTVQFTADKYFCGYFTFNNKNFNVIRIAFKNTKPYKCYSDSSPRNSIYKQPEFESEWNYNKVTVLLDFKEMDNGRLLLKKLSAMQKLTNFEYRRYSVNNTIIVQDTNSKFYTTLNMHLLE